MAELIGTFFHSHGGTTSIPGGLWGELRSGRPVREDVPIDDDATNLEKSARTHEGFRVLRDRIAELRPDVLVVFSDDQLECFDFNNYPAFAVFVGEAFKKVPDLPVRAGPRPRAEPGFSFKGHPDLGKPDPNRRYAAWIYPAFCMDMPKPDRGIAGGIIRTAEELTDWQTPIVPIMMNVYFTPQPTGLRCYQFGKAVREVIDGYPDNLRIAVVALGGLWHTPNQKGAWLNEAFDRRTLDYLKAGDARGWRILRGATYPGDDPSQDIVTRRRQVTGMPSVGNGPQFGSRETCTWISAAAVSEGYPTTIIDYIPVYASPVGNAFAYCDQV